MKWTKENKERLFHLLKKANISGLGIKKGKGIPGNFAEDRDYVVIPDPRNSEINRCLWIRAYLFRSGLFQSRGLAAFLKTIPKQIREECFVDVPSPLVYMVAYEYKDRKVVDPEWRKIGILKIPKEVAEKFLVLGVP